MTIDCFKLEFQMGDLTFVFNHKSYCSLSDFLSSSKTRNMMHVQRIGQPWSSSVQEIIARMLDEEAQTD